MPVTFAPAAASATSPRKLREMHNHHFDSTVWNDLDFRRDDVVVATYAKAGGFCQCWSYWNSRQQGQRLLTGSSGSR